MSVNKNLGEDSIFIRACTQTKNGFNQSYFASSCESNLTGMGVGLVLELRAVPKRATSKYNTIWLGNLEATTDITVFTFKAIQRKERGYWPYYIVSRKPNKSLLKRLEKMAALMEDPDDFNGDCGILEARSLISDCLKELSF